jgi:hypothetical protein
VASARTVNGDCSQFCLHCLESSDLDDLLSYRRCLVWPEPVRSYARVIDRTGNRVGASLSTSGHIGHRTTRTPPTDPWRISSPSSSLGSSKGRRTASLSPSATDFSIVLLRQGSPPIVACCGGWLLLRFRAHQRSDSVEEDILGISIDRGTTRCLVKEDKE